MRSEDLILEDIVTVRDAPGDTACAIDAVGGQLSDHELSKAQGDERYVKLCNARHILDDVMQKVGVSGWSKPSARTFVSTCNSVAGLIPANEVAYVLHIDTKALKKVLMDKQSVRIKWSAGRPITRDRRLIIAGRNAVPFTVIPVAPVLEELPPVSTMEDIPPSSFDDIAYADFPMSVIEPRAIARLTLSPPVAHESSGVCRFDTLPWILKESRLVRAEQDTDRLRKEREALIQDMALKEAEETRLRSRLGRMRKQLESLRTEAERLRGESQTIRMEWRLAREDLAVARDGRARVEAENIQLRRDIADLSTSADLRRLLRTSQECCAKAEKELASAREDIARKLTDLASLRELLSAADRKATRASESNTALNDECARLRVALLENEERAREDAALRARHPFFHEHMEFLRRKCGQSGGASPPYPHRGKIGGDEVDWHDYYVLLSQAGEYIWNYLQRLGGFPSWRTVQRWRVEIAGAMQLGAGIFDGTPQNVELLIRLIKAHLGLVQHSDKWKVAVACDAVATIADVVVEPNGNVRGLVEPMQIDVGEAELLKADPAAFARFVGEHERGVVTHLHVISVLSPVPAVPPMVLRVIPAPHGKATSEVTTEIERLVVLLNNEGLSVELVCTDGDSTYVQKLAAAFEVVGVCDSYDMRIPLHRQNSMRALIAMPGTFACYTIDIDHQGKGMRELVVKAEWLPVFPCFGDSSPEFATHVDVLKDAGVPPHLLRDFTAGKMDDVLASKLWSADYLTDLGEKMHQLLGLVNLHELPPDGLSEFGLCAHFATERENQSLLRNFCAAYWLHVVWVCLYQTMHGELSPTDRVFVASYGFCTVLVMLTMRQFIPSGCAPGERRNPRTGKRRWAMNEETCKKVLVTLFAVICGLAEVHEPIRANFFGTLTLERFFSCLRRVCHNNSHFLHMMEMLRIALMMSTIRSRLGLSPDLEEGTKRQKHGDVLFQPLPPGGAEIPMSEMLSIVLTAMVRSSVPLPDAFLECWAGLGVLAQPDGVPCFIEDLVVLSRSHRPFATTLRNTRLVATGGLGQVKQWATSHQVAHAADDALEAPSPPSPGPGWVPCPGAGPDHLVVFDNEPPVL